MKVNGVPLQIKSENRNSSQNVIDHRKINGTSDGVTPSKFRRERNSRWLFNAFIHKMSAFAVDRIASVWISLHCTDNGVSF